MRQLTGKCSALNDSGAGIFNNLAIEGLLPGEEAIIDADAKRILKLIKRSPDRIKTECPVFEQCGGCQFLHMNYAAQLNWKTDQVRQLFSPISKVPVNECLGAKTDLFYRSKNIYTFQKGNNRQIIAGYYAAKSHKLIDVESCLVQHPIADKIMASIRIILKQQHLEPYDEDKRTGLLRHVLVRVSHHFNEVMVVLVVGTTDFKGRNNFVSALKKSQPEITTIIENFNPRRTSIVLGNDERVLFGKGFILDKINESIFKISPRSFYQVHSEQMEVLYQTALDAAELTESDVVIDAYSGVSTIGILASPKVRQVICVESNTDAVKDARENGKMNQVKNVTYVAADAAQWMKEQSIKGLRADVVIIDPPREGCDASFISALVQLRPRRIVYISCDPYTQVRDIKAMKKFYAATLIQPIDMFPQTVHIENIVVLEVL